MPSGYSGFSNGCTAAMSIQAAALASRSVSASWSNTAAVSGWSDLLPAQDPLSPSPSRRETDRLQEPDETTPVAAVRRTVLLVEDNPIDAYVIKEVVAGCGLNLELRVAANGHDALLYFAVLMNNEKATCPALVLLDLNLPKIDGVEVLRAIRFESRCRDIPVIVVSSSISEEDRTAVQRLGATAYFNKPSDLSHYGKLADLIGGIFGEE
jgi:two-component system response regulator